MMKPETIDDNLLFFRNIQSVQKMYDDSLVSDSFDITGEFNQLNSLSTSNKSFHAISSKDH